MGKKTPSPPTPPDPTVVANAQSAANIATAQEQQRLNMVNSYGPDGSVTYKADPNAPGGYAQTTALSPGQQSLYDSGLSAQNSAIGVANSQIGRVGEALGHGLDLSSLPSLSGGVDLSNLGMGGIQHSFNPGQQVQGHVGPTDFNQAARDAANAVYGQAASRLDPQFAQQQEHLQAQLANQGLSQNSTAYQTAMDNFNRSKNDAYNQANFSSIGAGQNEQNTLFNQALNQGTFANQAAGQMYGQNQGLAAFNNAAQNQQFGQTMSADQLALQNAQFGNQARQQGLQEQAYVQNEPLNQFNSLMSSSQVGTPQGISYTPTAVAPTDTLGAYALNSQAANANYQASMQQQNSGMSGLFSLGAAALAAPMTGGGSLAGALGSRLLGSDIRLKTDIRRVGTLDSGVPVYSYRYKAGGPPMIGVMAHELAQVRPDAVYDVGGMLAVDYGAI